MSLFPRRSKFRRVPDDRSRPAPAEPSESLTPPDKRAARHLITALFLAAAAVILNLRATGPHFKAGEPAAREYRARVAFDIEDRDATRRAREAAMAACPRVFRENREYLDQLPRDLRRFLTSVLDARRSSDLADLEPSARAKWGRPIPASSPASALRMLSSSRSVTFDMADTTMTTGRLACCSVVRRAATLMRSAEPMLVPPNFITSNPEFAEPVFNDALSRWTSFPAPASRLPPPLRRATAP